MGKSSKERRDIQYSLAKEYGQRARSAFKLLHIDELYNLFEGVNQAVDLCSAPGSWSQVLKQKLQTDQRLDSNDEYFTLNPKIVSVDLQEVSTISGVQFIQADITANSTHQMIVDAFKGNLCELVVCDGAPDVSGFHCLDIILQKDLLVASILIAVKLLRNGGTFVCKVFTGNEFHYLFDALFVFFEYVDVFKPRSSRVSSQEHFIICRRFKEDSRNLGQILSEIQCEEDLEFINDVNVIKQANQVLYGDMEIYEQINNQMIDDQTRDKVMDSIEIGRKKKYK